MNRKKIILFNITSRCNESCSFCLKSSFLKKGLSDLDLQEIKGNYFFLKKSNHISHVVLTGGEPTLHSNFLKILDFFESQNVDISLVTNLLRISQSNYFFSKIKPYFSKDKNNRIIASVNHLPSFSQKEKQRALGFIKILQNQLNFGLTILIYKENIDTLGELSLWLRDNIERYYRGIFEIELRFLYFSETPKDILIDSLPKEKQVAPTVSDFLAPWSNTDLPVNIMPSRFPLCYINNFNKIDLGVIKLRGNRCYLLVDKEFQREKAQLIDVRGQGVDQCNNCLLRNICMAGDYLKYQGKGWQPSIKPFKKL